MRKIKHIKAKDVVEVITGKHKGKTGKVLRIFESSGRVTVEKLNMVKRHTRPTGQAPGGIIEKEAPLHASNVLPYCEKCGRGVRTRKTTEKGKKVRGCVKCGTQLK